MPADLHIRAMNPDELPIALDWAAAEGWNPGLDDAAPFFAADRQGFLIGLVENLPVAVISAVRYGADFGFIGFYIVHPGWRGKGYGWAIWQAAMARLAGRTIGLDGVLAQQDNYRRSGFVCAQRNVRYQGNGGGAAVPAPDGTPLVPLAGVPFATLEEYDGAFFPAGRRDFLRSWIAQPHATALALYDGARLHGYGVLRGCRNGYKIGPLFADTGDGAATLFHALRAATPVGTPLFLDVPECNPDAVALASGLGMTVMFETARMYAGPAPRLDMARTYGITSFELG